MTKELRKKFILINMALVGTVLLIVFMVLIESGVIKPVEKWLFRWKLS